MAGFIAQCKGTDSDTVHNIGKYWTLGRQWLWSIKYDGQYSQIHISNDMVMFYTSSGKPYTNKYLAKILLHIIHKYMLPMILEVEYLGNGLGMLGGRSDAASVTTLRTAFTKGIDISMEHRIKIFDIICDKPFSERLMTLRQLQAMFNGNNAIEVVEYADVKTIEDAHTFCNNVIAKGFEGIYVKSVNHTHQPGKRVKTAFKFKHKQQTIVKIVGIDEGIGKYTGLIGAFICEDSNGMQVNVGSGLTDSLRGLNPDDVIGKSIRISYERIDQTYIFPVFIDFVQA